MSLGNITAFTLYTYTEVSKGMVCLESIHKTSTDSELREDRGDPDADLWRDWTPSGSVELKNHWFRYSPDSPWIVRGVNIKIEPGEKVAFVGRSGAGKSTILKVLLKLYNNLEGGGDRGIYDTIQISGRRLSDIPALILRKHIFTIPQDPTILKGTVRYNLDPLLRYPESEHAQILESVELSAKIADKPASELSLGQRQMLHLGRILLAHPKIILMDEATANIDYKTQDILKRILTVQLKDSTLISISHRDDWIEGYDKVYAFGADGTVKLRTKSQ